MIAALLDHVWQSTLFAGVMGLLTLATRGNRARIRFTLWFAASVKFLVPFALLVTAASELILPFTAPVTTTPDAYMAQEAAQPFAVIAPSLPAPQIAGLNLLLVLFAVWALGFFTLLLVWFLRWLHLRLLLRSAAPMPLALPVTVKTAPGLLEPGLVGIWRPVLLLPVGVATRLTPGEMDAILAHEVCHFRRRDNLTAAIHMLVEALFWFYPLVWWLEARLVEERERACDESVVESGNTPDTYAEGILKVCRLYARSPLACASGVSGADLRLRIETIMAGAFAARLGPAKKAMLVASAAAVLAAPLLMGLSAPPMVEVKLPVPQLVRSSPLYADQVRPRKAIAMAPKSFDKYTGYYRLGPTAIFGPMAIVEITRNGPHFFARFTNQNPLEFFPASQSEFFNNRAYAQITFETDIQGKIAALVSHQNGLEVRALRMDAAEARRMQAELEQAMRDRVKSNKPFPGREEALRRLILSLERGKPDYENTSPYLAAILREGSPFIQSRIRNWGEMKSITFEKIAPNGWDIYKVRFANGSAEWSVGPLDQNGMIRGLGSRSFHFSGGLF